MSSVGIELIMMAMTGDGARATVAVTQIAQVKGGVRAVWEMKSKLFVGIGTIMPTTRNITTTWTIVL